MATTIAGFVYKKDSGTCVKVTSGKLIAYFKKVDSASSDSKWMTNPLSIDGNGFYSFSVEDNNLLTINGTYKRTKDKLYIAYYEGSARDSYSLTYAAFVDLTIPNADYNNMDITLEPVKAPVISSHTFPSLNLLTKHEYEMKETSASDYLWSTKDCGSYPTSQSQKYLYDSVEIFKGHQVTTTLYDWGNGTIRTKANSTNDKYTYTLSGVYNQVITTRELWNTQTIRTQQVTVKYNVPVPNFNWSPTSTNTWQGAKLKGQELITFTNTSSDLDNRTWDSATWGTEVYYYQWTITDKLQDGSDNTKVYSSKSFDYKPTHQFQSIGVKTITLKVYWNDGFADHVETISKTLEIFAFDIVPDFNWDILNPTNRGQLVTFNPDLTTGDTSKIVKYDWIIEDNFPAPAADLYTFGNTEDSIFDEGSTNKLVRVQNDKTFLNTKNPALRFHSDEVKTISLTITYYNGWVNVTESISKDLTPAKYTTTPTFSISDDSPMGRHQLVTFENTTSYIRGTVDIGYTIDWKLNDYYSACNLDNPVAGSSTDNYDELINVAKDTDITHYYQNTNTNSIEMTIRYDDGWQMVTKRLTKTVTPIVFPAPVPNFVWDPLVPISRSTNVTFRNTTSDLNNRFRAYDWIINDHYNKWNPVNLDYGVQVTDNTQSILYNTDYNLEPEHYFQDNTDENVYMKYYYDDGFCERSVEINKTITKTQYSITPDFTTNITPINNGFYGKNEIIYFNSSTGNINKMLDEKWVWNDRVFLTEADNITIRDNQVINLEQPFTFQTPSRKPYSATDKSTVQNVNKEVKLEIRIDTGWRNDTDAGDYDILENAKDGGQVYFQKIRNFEATPFEVTSNITYVCNVDNYSH